MKSNKRGDLYRVLSVLNGIVDWIERHENDARPPIPLMDEANEILCLFEDLRPRIRDLGTRLECVCCGRAAAQSRPGEYLLVYDGEELACGCRGHISVDADSEPTVIIDECDCGLGAEHEGLTTTKGDGE